MLRFGACQRQLPESRWSEDSQAPVYLYSIDRLDRQMVRPFEPHRQTAIPIDDERRILRFRILVLI